MLGRLRNTNLYQVLIQVAKEWGRRVFIYPFRVSHIWCLDDLMYDGHNMSIMDSFGLVECSEFATAKYPLGMSKKG